MTPNIDEAVARAREWLEANPEPTGGMFAAAAPSATTRTLAHCVLALADRVAKMEAVCEAAKRQRDLAEPGATCPCTCANAMDMHDASNAACPLSIADEEFFAAVAALTPTEGTP